MSCCPEILPNEAVIIQLRKELFQARYDASFYKSHYQNGIVIRERMKYEHEDEIRKLKKKHTEQFNQFEKKIKELEANLKLRERQLFGKKSEQSSGRNESNKKDKSKRKRGQQQENKSPAKRDYSHLPIIDQSIEIPEDERTCPCCKALYADMGATEDSNVIEVEVQAHIRKIKRKKYRRTCACLSQPPIITANQVSKVLSKSHLGNSVWVHFLMRKYWHGQPLHRVIQELSSHGVSIPVGTMLWGFKRLLPLLRVIYQKIVDRSLQDKHWHADETGWKVFEALEGKVNNRWFLWIFRSASTAVFVLDPSRAARVVQEFFGNNSSGIISCDRYRAYFCFTSKSRERFLIAYCWVHVRRDFLAIAKDWPIHETWGMDWVLEIRNLYHLNNLRVAEAKGSPKFSKHQQNLEEGISNFKEKVDIQLENKKLAEPCRKALESLNRHWQGLTTFIEHSEVPMDNNVAERGLRGGAIGRKNYYGSGSVESAEFTAIMFSIIQTLLIWKVNPQVWFSQFFDFIDSDWEKAFDDWLPWNMTSEQQQQFSFEREYIPPH